MSDFFSKKCLSWYSSSSDVESNQNIVLDKFESIKEQSHCESDYVQENGYFQNELMFLGECFIEGKRKAQTKKLTLLRGKSDVKKQVILNVVNACIFNWVGRVWSKQ